MVSIECVLGGDSIYNHIYLIKDSVISAPVLRAAPDNYDEDTKPPAQQGMIIYNTEKSCLQFYNGEKWVTLKECEED